MTAVVVLLLFAIAAWALVRARKNRDRRAPSAPEPRPSAAPSYTRPPVPVPQPRVSVPAPGGDRRPQRMPFAQPGMRGSLFQYGGENRGVELDVPFAVIDVETTGLSPRRGDRIIEVAVARVDRSGRILDEFSTLINPDGQDTGPVFVHGISNDAVRDAPRFIDVVDELLVRLDGAVVVAHNAVFEEQFLASELWRAGVAMPVVPALCTLWLAQQTLKTPNHKLGTLARYAGLPTVDAHAALGDVRTVAALLPTMLSVRGRPLLFGCGLTPLPLQGRGRVRPKTRAVELRKGTDGWMSSLMARLPMSAAELNDADAQRYIELLAAVLEDGKIVGEEAKALGKLAGSAGLGAAQVRELHMRFLESMRVAALEDEVLTAAELRQLRTTAQLLGLQGYFDDMVATPVPRTSVEELTGQESSPVRRCGNCRLPGHNRATCPELTGTQA